MYSYINKRIKQKIMYKDACFYSVSDVTDVKKIVG